ncbi:MAG: phosphate ABC transporter permease subunit PstC [Methanosarcinaceae archaeon]
MSVQTDKELKDVVWKWVLLLCGLTVAGILIIIILTLIGKSLPILAQEPLQEIFLSSLWDPESGRFGLLSMIFGTLIVTTLSMVISVPVAILCSIYLAEYASKRGARMLQALIDILAGIPSVVFGMCAILVLVPLVRDVVGPFFGQETTGFCVLTASLTLAIMVLPIMISLSTTSMRAMPREIKEIAMALGSTRWQMVKHVMLRGSLPGILSAILLGFGRAFGETMAVAMVIGNMVRVPSSPFDPAVTLPSLIATTYGEMMSIPLYDSAVMLAALVLVIIVVMFNVIARLLTRRAKWGWA